MLLENQIGILNGHTGAYTCPRVCKEGWLSGAGWAAAVDDVADALLDERIALIAEGSGNFHKSRCE